MHSFFGKKNSDFIMGILFNKVINSFLKNVTGIDYNFNFKVKSRSGSDDEVYHWVLEINTDKPIQELFEYSDEMKIKKRADGFHISILQSEFRKVLKSSGLYVGDQSVGVYFLNEK